MHQSCVSLLWWLLKVDKTKMLEMYSREGEKVKFETPVDAKGNIEVWLQRLVDGMQVNRLVWHGVNIGHKSRCHCLDWTCASFVECKCCVQPQWHVIAV